jgi:hypothetical protein
MYTTVKRKSFTTTHLPAAPSRHADRPKSSGPPAKTTRGLPSPRRTKNRNSTGQPTPITKNDPAMYADH